MTRALAAVLAVAVVACAGGPSGTPSGTGVWGYVKLVPREGVTPGRAGAYGDRRLADVRLVDYARPGFVVVYADGEAGPAGSVTLALRERATGVRFEPERSAVGVGGSIEIRNETDVPQVLSAREHGRLETLAPGRSATFSAAAGGEHGFALLSGRGAEALVFVAPGPFTVASESGRFDLAGVGPGRHRLVAWHPRFPAAAHWLELGAGERRQLDIEIGVDRPAELGE